MKLLRNLSRGEGGSATVVMTSCLFLALVFCLFLADVGIFLVGRSHAQNAADAASIAAVQESFPLFSTGETPQKAAKSIASLNQAHLDKIDISKSGERVSVKAYIKPEYLILDKFGVGSSKISADAAAEIDIEALMASGMYAEESYIPGRNSKESSTIVVSLALKHLGKPYSWGATGPNRFDCSGLVYYVYAQVGIRLPRVARMQAHAGMAVSAENLIPGDLVFFRGNSHVGIYIGNGNYVHAPHTGDVVKISPLRSRRDISACRRIL
ncbi:MAG: C40 family peptidase [Actinomycetota bacterium]|nr:C40 family peptidase [Actinomycetota bacterium]